MDWQLFFSVFFVIFLAELPDKSTLTALALTSRYDTRGVFLGAAGALTVQSLIAVFLGAVALRFLPGHWVRWLAGLVFLIVTVFLWRESSEEEEVKMASAATGSQSVLKSAAAALGFVFLAEWGDMTQLAISGFAAKYHAPATIFTAAALAEISSVGLGIYLGHTLKKKLPRELVQKLAAAVFACVGIYLLIS